MRQCSDKDIMSFPEIDRGKITKASDILRAGGVVAFPTETGYGLGASVFLTEGSKNYNIKGLERIYAIKHRPSNKPLLVLVDSIKMLERLMAGRLEGDSLNLAKQFWPGPVTLLLRALPDLPWALTGNTGKVGTRISSHPWAMALVKETGSPITATSANITGMEMALSAHQVRKQLLSPPPDMILDGGYVDGGGIPSTIVDCTTKHITVIRKGIIDPLK